MSTQLKLRRGTTAQHSTFTGAEGEVTVDTTKDTLVVHDGTTAGGVPLARADGNVASATTAATATALATGRTIALTGDVSYTSPSFTGAANVTAAATLAASGVTAGTYGSASAIPAITVDAKGRVTSATTNAVASSAPTTAQVLNATASASAGAVGTYALLGRTASGATTQGTTYAGSNLRFVAIAGGQSWATTYLQQQIVGNQGTPSGTWRALSSVPDGVYCSTFGAGFFLRVS